MGLTLKQTATETKTRLALIEQAVISLSDITKDHESRLRRAERWMMYGSGIAAAASLALHFFEVFKK